MQKVLTCSLVYHGVNLHISCILGLFRLVRVVRVLQVVNVFLHSDFSRTEGPVIQMLITSVIAANGAILSTQQNQLVLVAANNAANLFFCFELGLRFEPERSYFLDDGMSIISYRQFIEKLSFENKQVSELSFFRLDKQMRLLEAGVEQKPRHMQDEFRYPHNINCLFDDKGNAKVIRRAHPSWKA